MPFVRVGLNQNLLLAVPAKGAIARELLRSGAIRRLKSGVDHIADPFRPALCLCYSELLSLTMSPESGPVAVSGIDFV
jgi:hypothetical protein